MCTNNIRLCFQHLIFKLIIVLAIGINVIIFSNLFRGTGTTCNAEQEKTEAKKKDTSFRGTVTESWAGFESAASWLLDNGYKKL